MYEVFCLLQIFNSFFPSSDENDNPPEFASHTYYTTVTENANIGTDIVRVLATSRDSGKNAEITYSIIGGNEHRKFSIHPKIGVYLPSCVFYFLSFRFLIYTAREASEGVITAIATKISSNVALGN